MRHPRLRALRLSLVAALGAVGCQDTDSTACVDPEPVLDPAGEPTGVQRCADGTERRFASVACEPRVDIPACDGGGGCAVDADCAARPHGRCVISQGFTGLDEGCACAYGCASDADCGAGEVCLCPGVVDGSSHCAPASCTTDADCASGACLVNATTDGCGQSPRVACLDPDRDECHSHADCGGDDDPYCIRDDERWVCSNVPVCGRPLTVAGAARTAPLSARADWATAPRRAAPTRAGLAGLRGALLDAIA